MTPLPQITVRANIERSAIIAAAYASDMPTSAFEDLVAELYPEDFEGDEA